MKRILILILVGVWMFQGVGVGQVVSPEEYESEFKMMEKKVAELEKKWDVVLTPGEQIGRLPGEYSLQVAGGNYGRELHGVKEVDKSVLKERLKNGKKIVFFIFDTAPKFTHTDLQAAQWNALARSFTGESTDFDEHGHGTHVGGIIAAVSSQYEIGVMMEAVTEGLVKLVPIRVLNKDGAGNYTQNIFPGIDYALPVSRDLVKQGWGVIWNFSLGGAGVNAQMNDRLRIAEEAGVLVVAAAGNTGVEGIGTPGNAPSAHASAAVNKEGKRGNFSTYGKEMYMSGGGVGIMSTFKGGGYAEMSGTSMGSPHVAVMLGWAWCLNPTATNRQISHYGKRQAVDLEGAGWDKFTGWGLNKLGKLMEGDASKEPNTGNGRPGEVGPEPEPDTKNEWTARVVLGEYRILWKTLTQVGGSFRSTNLRFVAERRTRYFARVEGKRIKDDVDGFFMNRGFLLREKDDEVNAGEWALYFLEMDMRNKKRELKGVDIEVQNEDGIWFKVERSATQNLKMRLRKTAEVSTITGEWIY